MENSSQLNSDFHSVEFHYSFTSGLGAWEEHRYVKEHVLRIVLTDETGAVLESIGEVRFLMVHLAEILASHHHPHSILDAHSEYLARHIFKVFDPSEEEFTEKVVEHYGGDLLLLKVCFIREIKIKPKFRGYQIGAKAIKDIIFHFGSSCGLVMLEAYPLQFETLESRIENHAFELEKLEKDEEMATYKLLAYYQRIGFETIEGIKGLVFYNPALKNSKMDEIDLEEDCIIKDREHDNLEG